MSKSSPAPTQPKIVHRLVVRTLCLILLLGVCIKAYQWWSDKSQDLGNLKSANTVGWLAAVQFQQDGQQVVAISPDGKVTPAPGWAQSKTDRDATWNPSGNRLFFVSDREDNNYNVFRWNPTDGSDPGRRSVGTRSNSLPEFPREPVDNADDAALIIRGGFALQYTPKDMSTVQLLPPENKEVTQDSTEEGGGQADQFSGVYAHLGTSFRVAKWCKGKQWIAAVMRRDEGEVLVLQYMTPDDKGQYPTPLPIATGDHVEFDVNPKDGNVVFDVQNFITNPDSENPSNAKAAKVPFRHLLASVDPGDGSPKNVKVTRIAASQDDKLGFASPAVSPDGASVAFLVGPYKDGAVSPEFLATAPIAEAGAQSKAVLVTGKVHEPSWSPDGDLLAFAQDMPDGHRAIVEVHKDGTGIKNITGDAGNFGNPVFSPQQGS